MATETAPWDSGELLRDKEDLVAYLDAALDEVAETGDTSAFTRAADVVARSHGMAKIEQRERLEPV